MSHTSESDYQGGGETDSLKPTGPPVSCRRTGHVSLRPSMHCSGRAILQQFLGCVLLNLISLGGCEIDTK